MRTVCSATQGGGVGGDDDDCGCDYGGCESGAVATTSAQCVSGVNLNLEIKLLIRNYIYRLLLLVPHAASSTNSVSFLPFYYRVFI